MTEGDTNFSQAKLKLAWANNHIGQCNRIWRDYLKSDFCTLSVVNVGPQGETLRIESTKPLPDEFLLTLGDAVHNLRSALDYVVNELLGWKDKRLSFPMDETKQGLENSFQTQIQMVEGKTKGKGKNAKLEEAIGGIGKFIVNELAPYKAAENYLWVIGQLDNRDKHRLLIPLFVPQTIEGIHAVDKNHNEISNFSATIGAQQCANIVGFAGGVKITSHGKLTAKIVFNEGDTIAHVSVLETLQEMSKQVENTIMVIDRFVSAAGWIRPTET